MTDVVLFGVDEARALTDRIRESGATLSALVVKAHDGEAWRALGYASWAAYVEGEFDFSRRHSYMLLDVGRATEVVKHASHIDRPPTTREARAVVRQPDVVRDAIASGVLASEAYQAAVRANPKPGGGKRRGYQAPEDKARGLAETLEEWCDDVDGDVVLPAGFVRSLERIRDAAVSLLYLHEQAVKQPTRIDEWQSA